FTTPPTPEISTLSLHDALPIWPHARPKSGMAPEGAIPGNRFVAETQQTTPPAWLVTADEAQLILEAAFLPNACMAERQTTTTSADRKSTRLNSSHVAISYAVFC